MAYALLSIQVTPRAGHDEITGWRDGELLVRLRAVPAEGKANEALRRVLVKQIGIAASGVELVSGATSRHKRVRIEGLTADEVRARLG